MDERNSNRSGALTDLHLRGLRIVGSEADAQLTAREADLRGPLALVIGSEGHGLSPAIRRRCDLFVRIPMRGMIGSLNAAVAGSILLFEALGQHDPKASPGDPAGSAAPAAKPRAARASTKASPRAATKAATKPAKKAATKPATKAGSEAPAEPAVEPSTEPSTGLGADAEADAVDGLA